MIDHDRRTAVIALFAQGRGKREIARLLEISRKTVKNIIKAEGKILESKRKDTIEIEEERLRKLHVECDGRIQRIHEKLTEEDGVEIGYSTLSRKMREMGLGRNRKPRSERVPDAPGEEF